MIIAAEGLQKLSSTISKLRLIGGIFGNDLASSTQLRHAFDMLRAIGRNDLRPQKYAQFARYRSSQRAGAL